LQLFIDKEGSSLVRKSVFPAVVNPSSGALVHSETSNCAPRRFACADYTRISLHIIVVVSGDLGSFDTTMAGLVRSGPVDSTAVQSSTPVSIAFKDNSNPQQGSMIGARSGHTRTDDHSGSRATVPMASATAQVGRPSLKIPPHRKDARKLFVGGLPVDSK
jgi:hypothetical protein